LVAVFLKLLNQRTSKYGLSNNFGIKEIFDFVSLENLMVFLKEWEKVIV
jgi:hypothetical protein